MRIVTSYKVKIRHYNHIFRDTVEQYRRAVRFFLEVCDARWAELSTLTGKSRNNRLERLTIQTKKNPAPEYGFSQGFYKFPSYLRRAAIQEALGLYSGYQAKLEAWGKNPAGRKPSLCRTGGMMPAMYRDNMYVRTGEYTAKVKVYIRNTWDWLEIDLRKSDVENPCRRRQGWPLRQKFPNVLREAPAPYPRYLGWMRSWRHKLPWLSPARMVERQSAPLKGAAGKPAVGSTWF